MSYEPVARLGRGGMGVVDLARDRQGNRVAMKRLTLTGSAGDIMRARQRLLREAEVLRRLHHPNVVRLLDVVEEGDDIVLVMPYLNGGNLAERVSQHGPAPAEEVERLAQRLLGALAAAHAAGIIHRDIKPANVLFDEKGEPCLVDFGVAYTRDQTGGLTVAGMVVGTPGFMAPEQARDEPLTPASDIFALGATLLYAATGTGPFGAGDPGLLMVRAAAGKVERIPKTLPAGLRRRLKAMLHPRPERRPTAAALLTGDHSALRRPPARTRLTGAGPAVAFAAFAGAVVLVALTVSASRRDSDESEGGVVPTVQEDEPSPDPGQTGEDEPSADPGPDAGEDADESPLVDQADGVLDASGVDVDTYLVPIPEAPAASDDGRGGCPELVTIMLAGPPQAPLQLQVYRSATGEPGGALIGEATTADGDASVEFRPGACGEEVPYVFRVIITSVDEAEGMVPYRIIREDS